MSLPTTSWVGSAYRHIPADTPHDILDFRFAGLHPGNRWNESGEPTLYLAGDPGVLVAEWGRHLATSFSRDAAARVLRRMVYRLHLRLDEVIDVRDSGVLRELGLTGAPGCFTDKGRARSVARMLRESSPAQAMLVPSVAFLDDLTRWNLVIFLDKLPPDPAEWIQRVETVGPLRWG